MRIAEFITAAEARAMEAKNVFLINFGLGLGVRGRLSAACTPTGGGERTKTNHRTQAFDGRAAICIPLSRLSFYHPLKYRNEAMAKQRQKCTITA